jgi:hypothetical protein
MDGASENDRRSRISPHPNGMLQIDKSVVRWRRYLHQVAPMPPRLPQLFECDKNK